MSDMSDKVSSKINCLPKTLFSKIMFVLETLIEKTKSFSFSLQVGQIRDRILLTSLEQSIVSKHLCIVKIDFPVPMGGFFGPF